MWAGPTGNDSRSGSGNIVFPMGGKALRPGPFGRAKEAAESNPAFTEIFQSKRGKNEQLEADPDFAKMFASERKRIGQMQVKVVKVLDDPTIVAGRNGLSAAQKQYFFEAYVAAAYDIPFDWDTH